MTDPRPSRESGVTLIEMMIVTLLIALLAGISFPAVSAGLESLRLNAATRSIASLFNSAMNRAERRQEAVEVVILPGENRLRARTVDNAFRRDLKLPDGVVISGVLPAPFGGDASDAPAARSFFLYPGGALPAIGVLVRNRRGDQRLVQVDPITGVPSVVNPTPSTDDSQ